MTDHPKTWPAPTVPEPTPQQLQQWLVDRIAEATDGCSVDLNGICPHGHPSWLLRWDLISRRSP